MSLKYEIVKRAVKAVGLKNRGKMTADEIIAFKKKQNAKIGIPNIRDKEITVSQVSDACQTRHFKDVPYRTRKRSRL